MSKEAEDVAADEERFEHLKNTLGEENYSKLMAGLKSRLSYSPVILFMGKTGVGKSSTCNALFGSSMFKVDDVAACTREIQVEDLELPDRSLTLVDVPGVGENETYTEAYKKLYKEILTKGVKDKNGNRRQPDAVVYIFKADDRALQTELECYRDVLSRNFDEKELSRVVLAINQADKIEPLRGNGGWDAELARPGSRQLENLDRKRTEIAKTFGVESNLVIDYSAGELYNLDRLLERIVYVLPKERIPLVVNRALHQERALQEDTRRDAVLVNESVLALARRSLWDTAEDVGTVLFGSVGGAAVRVARDFYTATRDTFAEIGREVKSLASRAWDKITSWF